MRQTIFRNARPETGFTTLSNQLLNHGTLSSEALALAAAILAKVETWKFNLAWARKRFDWGETKSEKIMRELIAEGFVRKLPQQRLANGEWTPVIYEFTDVPHTFDNGAAEFTERCDGETVSTDHRAVENGSAENAEQEKTQTVEISVDGNCRRVRRHGKAKANGKAKATGEACS